MARVGVKTCLKFWLQTMKSTCNGNVNIRLCLVVATCRSYYVTEQQYIEFWGELAHGLSVNFHRYSAAIEYFNYGKSEMCYYKNMLTVGDKLNIEKNHSTGCWVFKLNLRVVGCIRGTIELDGKILYVFAPRNKTYQTTIKMSNHVLTIANEVVRYFIV